MSILSLLYLSNSSSLSELIFIILIPTSFIEYSLDVIFELGFFLDGFLIIPGKDAQLFKKNAKIIKILKLFFKKIIY